MANFDKYTNYTEETSFSEVIFAADSPLLEVELNEAQKILNTKINRVISQLGDGCYPDDDNDYYDRFDWFNTIFTLKNCVVASKKGYTIYIKKNSLNIGNKVRPINWEDYSGNTKKSERDYYIFVRFSEEIVTYQSVLKFYGDTNGNTIVNPIKDSRWDNETSRRKVIKYTLMGDFSVPSDTAEYTYVKIGYLHYTFYGSPSRYTGSVKFNKFETLSAGAMKAIEQSALNAARFNKILDLGKSIYYKDSDGYYGTHEKNIYFGTGVIRDLSTGELFDSFDFKHNYKRAFTSYRLFWPSNQTMYRPIIPDENKFFFYRFKGSLNCIYRALSIEEAGALNSKERAEYWKQPKGRQYILTASFSCGLTDLENKPHPNEQGDYSLEWYLNRLDRRIPIASETNFMVPMSGHSYIWGGIGSLEIPFEVTFVSTADYFFYIEMKEFRVNFLNYTNNYTYIEYFFPAYGDDEEGYYGESCFPFSSVSLSGSLDIIPIGYNFEKLGSSDVVFDSFSQDYNNLVNKPQINSVVLQGNKTSEDLHIEGGGSGGTTNYEDLENLPTLNGQTIIGDMIESDPKYTDEHILESDVDTMLDNIFGGSN